MNLVLITLRQAPYDEDWYYIRCASMARHMYIRCLLNPFPDVMVRTPPLIEAKHYLVSCWVIMWATKISSNGPGSALNVPLWTTQDENISLADVYTYTVCILNDI